MGNNYEKKEKSHSRKRQANVFGNIHINEKVQVTEKSNRNEQEKFLNKEGQKYSSDYIRRVKSCEIFSNKLVYILVGIHYNYTNGQRCDEILLFNKLQANERKNKVKK